MPSLGVCSLWSDWPPTEAQFEFLTFWYFWMQLCDPPEILLAHTQPGSTTQHGCWNQNEFLVSRHVFVTQKAQLKNCNKVTKLLQKTFTPIVLSAMEDSHGDSICNVPHTIKGFFFSSPHWDYMVFFVAKGDPILNICTYVKLCDTYHFRVSTWKYQSCRYVLSTAISIPAPL
jgi:hypothetical protein